MDGGWNVEGQRESARGEGVGGRYGGWRVGGKANCVAVGRGGVWAMEGGWTSEGQGEGGGRGRERAWGDGGWVKE